MDHSSKYSFSLNTLFPAVHYNAPENVSPLSGILFPLSGQFRTHVISFVSEKLITHKLVRKQHVVPKKE